MHADSKHSTQPKIIIPFFISYHDLSDDVYLSYHGGDYRDYDDVDVMRKLVDKSMNEALLYALSYSIKDLISSGRALHLDTINAYNDNI